MPDSSSIEQASGEITAVESFGSISGEQNVMISSPVDHFTHLVVRFRWCSHHGHFLVSRPTNDRMTSCDIFGFHQSTRHLTPPTLHRMYRWQ